MDPFRIAIPITARTQDDVFKDYEAIAALPQRDGIEHLIELRADFLQDPDIETLLLNAPLPVIVTNRIDKEGGQYAAVNPEDETRRLATLSDAAQCGAYAVDVEMEQYAPLWDPTAPLQTQLIISHHNFNYTTFTLDETADHMKEQGADIVKIATNPQSYQDNVRMLQFIGREARRESPQDVIGICMGEQGMITRILGPLYGGFLTFGALTEEKASASGQIGVQELGDKLLKAQEMYERKEIVPANLLSENRLKTYSNELL